MEIYLVGGAVRDELLGYPIFERDYVVIGASPEEMEAMGFTPVGNDFPVFLHPQSKDEYALARTERKNGRGYKGFSFRADHSVTLEEDLMRRDLTINAIAKSSSGEIIDPYNGRADIESKTLRHVSLAFCEDPVRILRVARFAARYRHLGFNVANETLELMRNMVNEGEVDFLVAERVWKEFSRALGERNPEVFLATLNACGALVNIMPEIDRLICTTQQQKPLATTPLRALHYAAQHGAPSHIRFSCLMHDSDLDKDELSNFFERIKIPNEFSELARLVIENHQDIESASKLNASGLYDLFIRCDALRRPERFYDVISCCRLYQESRGLECLEEIALRTALNKVTKIRPQALIAKGYTGKALGEQLKQARLHAIEE